MANCTNCGKPLKEGMKFCTSCGTPVKGGASAKPAAPVKSETAKPEPVAAAPAKPPAPAPVTYAPTYAPTYAGPDDVMGTGGWFGVIILSAIPIVGLILYLVWAFGTGGNLNRRNYCRASLLMWAIILVLSIITIVMTVVAFGSLAGGLGDLLEIFF